MSHERKKTSIYNIYTITQKHSYHKNILWNFHFLHFSLTFVTAYPSVCTISILLTTFRTNCITLCLNFYLLLCFLQFLFSFPFFHPLYQQLSISFHDLSLLSFLHCFSSLARSLSFFYILFLPFLTASLLQLWLSPQLSTWTHHIQNHQWYKWFFVHRFPFISNVWSLTRRLRLCISKNAW